MPQVKQEIRHFGEEAALGPAFCQWAADRKVVMFEEEAAVLIRVALHPKQLGWRRAGAKLRDAFGTLYARMPDACLEALTFLRGLLARQDMMALLWFRSHDSVRWRGHLTAVHDLTDGEVSQILNMPISSVKRGRQLAVKSDPLWDILRDPGYRQYMRTGVAPSKVKRVKGIG